MGGSHGGRDGLDGWWPRRQERPRCAQPQRRGQARWAAASEPGSADSIGGLGGDLDAVRASNTERLVDDLYMVRCGGLPEY
jgi:hypothetical protein